MFQKISTLLSVILGVQTLFVFRTSQTPFLFKRSKAFIRRAYDAPFIISQSAPIATSVRSLHAHIHVHKPTRRSRMPRAQVLCLFSSRLLLVGWLVGRLLCSIDMIREIYPHHFSSLYYFYQRCTADQHSTIRVLLLIRLMGTFRDQGSMVT